ncbi:hypothetical protein ACFX13_027989 [Malus domestica]
MMKVLTFCCKSWNFNIAWRKFLGKKLSIYIEAVSEGEWTSLSGIYTVEEVDFMSQLLGNFVNQTSIIGIDPDLAWRQL